MGDLSFAQNLREARKKKGLTQEELASLVGVHETTIRRWENKNNTSFPSIEAINQLAEVLGVPKHYLLNEAAAIGWSLSVRIAQDFREEVIDMTQPIPLVATITTTKDGGLLTLGGAYSNWTDDKAFNSLVADLYRLRSSVIQNGKALGGIKD